MFRLFSFGLLTLIVGCTDDQAPSSIDKELYLKAKDTSYMVWYADSPELLDKSAGSGHDFPFLRTRFNAIAAQSLDSNSKIQEGAIFAEGSLIVKELITADGSLGRYAILYKETGSPAADENGWVWGYINADGTTYTTAIDRGISCIGCHAQSGNIDKTLMNKFF